MNDRVDVALACRAEGVHLGPKDMPLREARRILGPRLLVGVSVYTSEEAEEAGRIGAAYVATDVIREFVQPGEPSEDLFRLYRSFLETLDSCSRAGLLLAWFRIRSLALLGFLPELGRCVGCGASLPKGRGAIPVDLIGGDPRETGAEGYAAAALLRHRKVTSPHDLAGAEGHGIGAITYAIHINDFTRH